MQLSGITGAAHYMQAILGGAIASIPSCPAEARLAQTVLVYARRLTELLVTASPG